MVVAGCSLMSAMQRKYDLSAETRPKALYESELSSYIACLRAGAVPSSIGSIPLGTATAQKFIENKALGDGKSLIFNTVFNTI